MLRRIMQQLQNDDIIEGLASLPGADFNSLMLEVFNRRASKITPQQLLSQYRLSRFVKPAETDCLQFLNLQTATLSLLQEQKFQPVALSPLAPLGTCSVLGTVSQNKVVSAIRGLEVLADATNAIALHIAHTKQAGTTTGPLHYCAVSQHVRAQALSSEKFTAFFTIGCLVSEGIDTGSYTFECTSLVAHLRAWTMILHALFNITALRYRLLPRGDYPRGFAEHVKKHLDDQFPEIKIELKESAGVNNYYKGVQFKIVIEVAGQELEICDGGFTDWPQKLLNNKKERMLISGFGLELLHKLTKGLS
jgi:hypothetical protein